MSSKNISNDRKSIGSDNSKVNLENLKSDYFIQKICDNINKKKSMEIVKYNKKLQKRVNLNITDYKEY